MLVLEKPEVKLLANRAREYLQTVLHLRLALTPWDNSAQLPVILSRRFGFWRGMILNIPCVFVVVDPSEEMTPAEFEKRNDHLQSLSDYIIVFVFGHLSSYNRARLIERAVSFVVPDNQLYIPQLALDLREHFRSRAPQAEAHLSPVSQVILLRYLLLEEQEEWNPTGLAKVLRYSPMSVGRAFEEISSHGLARIETRGRSKYLVFEEPKGALFQKARALLRSPVVSTHYFRSAAVPKGFFGSHMPEHLPRIPTGGEDALAERSMLSRPKQLHFAVGPTDWKMLQADAYNTEIDHPEDAHFSVDVWRYDPDIVSGEAKADSLSLYLQFHEFADERVAGAASQLMEQYEWFKE